MQESRIRLRVIDVSNAAINAWLEVEYDEYRVVKRSAQADGFIELVLPAGQSLTGTISAPDYISVSIEIDPLQPDEVRQLDEVMLERGVGFELEVVDEHELPVANAFISLWAQLFDDGSLDTTLIGFPKRHCKRGVLRGSGLQPGEYELNLSAPGYIDRTLALRIDRGKNQHRLRLELAGQLHGHIIYDTGEPVKEAHLRVESEDYNSSRDTSDENGYFEFVDAPVADITLSISAGGAPSNEIQAERLSDLKMPIVFKRGADLMIKLVKADGTPWIGKVELQSNDEDGHTEELFPGWLTTNLPPGAYTVHAWAHGFEPLKPLPLTLVKGQSHSVQLSRGERIPTALVSVRVTDESGRSLPHTPISISDQQRAIENFFGDIVYKLTYGEKRLLANVDGLLRLQLPIGSQYKFHAQIDDLEAEHTIEIKDPSPLNIDLILKR